MTHSLLFSFYYLMSYKKVFNGTKMLLSLFSVIICVASKFLILPRIAYEMSVVNAVLTAAAGVRTHTVP